MQSTVAPGFQATLEILRHERSYLHPGVQAQKHGHYTTTGEWHDITGFQQRRRWWG